MKFSNKNLLSIAVCTKRIGVAVFSQTELLYFAVKTLQSPRTIPCVRRQVSQIFETLLTEYSPKLIILKLPGKQQMRSKNLEFVHRVVKKNSEIAGVSLRKISFENAKQILCVDKKPTKTNAFLALAKIYPELRLMVKCQNPAQAEYYNSLLSAVAVGYYFQNKNGNIFKENTK
jgi:RNase H-fold protein (predicted Holliday junction resolvase)